MPAMGAYFDRLNNDGSCGTMIVIVVITETPVFVNLKIKKSQCK